MKKKHGLLLATAIALGIQLHAQSRLTQLGAPTNYEVVQRPLLYYDIMRTQLPSWIREQKESNNANWEKLNMVINKKDASGKLTNLSFFSYNANESKWDTRNIHLYEYELSGNNIVSEKRDTWINDGNEITVRNTTNTFMFQNDKIVKRLQLVAYGANTLETEQFYNYDNNGRLTFDSSIFSYNSNPFSYKAYYHYNNNNQCIKYVAKTANDTSYYYNYGYTLDKLNLYEYYSFNTTSGKKLLEKEQYTYDSQGRVDEVIIYYSYDNVTTTNLYKHGYTQDGKLLWMTRYEKNTSGNNWLMGDSTAINYKNGVADTSYGYLASNGTAWNNWPSLRYTFNTNFTGIHANVQSPLSFTVYPNPARSTLNIQLTDNAKIKMVTVSDLLGRTVLASTASAVIHLENIKPGTYFVTVETEQGKGTKKIIITE